MPVRLPPLAAVRCFEAVVRHGTFTRAGEELAMTQAAVSYQIRMLEERVGLSLFIRRPRGVELTPAGARLAPKIQDAFAAMRAAFEDLADDAGNQLVIDSVFTFASNWLASRLGAFQLANPSIAVRLITNLDLADFSRGEVDVAIRSGLGTWPGLVTHPLRPVEFTVLMSPRLAATVTLATPADLLALPLIDPRDPWWTVWFAAQGVDPGDLARRTDFTLHTQMLAARAAMAGHGAAIVTPAFFREEIDAGLLVQPFPYVASEARSYFLVYPESRRHAPTIRAFRDWLLAALAEDKAGGGA